MINKRILLCLAHMSEAGEDMRFVNDSFDINRCVV